MNYYFSSKKLISSALAFCLASTTLNAYLPEDVHTTLDDTDQELTKKNNKSQKTNKRIQNPYSLSVVDPTLKNTLQDQSSLHFRQTGVLDISANAIETITDLSTFAYSVVNLGEGSTLNLGSNGDGRLDPKSSLTINFNGANSEVHGGSTYRGKNNINIDVARTGVFYLPDDHSNGTLYLKSLTLQDSSSMSFIGGKQLEIQNLISGANATLTFSTNNQFDSSQTVHLGSQMDGDTSTLELSGHRSSSGSSIYGIIFWLDSPNAQNTIKHLTTNDGYHQIFLKGSLTIKDKVEISSNQTAQKYLTFAFNDNQSENILKFENGIDIGGSASANFYFSDGIGKIITKDNILIFNEGRISFDFSPNSTGAFSYLLDEQGNIGKIINGTTTEVDFDRGDSTFVTNIHTIDTQTQGKSPGYTNFTIDDYANSAKHYGNITSEGLGKNYLSFFNKQYEKEIAFYGENIHFSQIQFYGQKAFLTLDSSHNAVIMQADNIEKLSTSTATSGILHLNFRSQDNLATFDLRDQNSVFKSITIESGKNNVLAISQSGGSLEIDEKVSIGLGKGIAFDLSSGSNITFTGGLDNAGSTSFNLGQTNILSGAITNSGTLSFNVLENSNLQYANGLSFSTGENNIVFKKNNTSLNWQDSNGSARTIATNGGTTNIKFDNSGTIAGNIATTAGSTTFDLGDGNSTSITATVSGNITNSTTNTFNVNATNAIFKNGVSGLVFGTANATNQIIFNKEDSTLHWQGASDTIDHDISTSNGTTYIAFLATNATLSGGISTTGGNATIYVGDTSGVNNASGIIKGEVSGTDITFGATTGSKTLALRGATNTIAALDATEEGTLILDGANSTQNGKVTATITTLTQHNLVVNLNGDSTATTKGAELTLTSGTNTIASLTLGSIADDGNRTASKGNKLILQGGTTTISDANGVSVGANQELEIDFNGTVTSGLTLENSRQAKTLSNTGVTTLNFKKGEGTLAGVITTNIDGNTTINIGNDVSATGAIKGTITGNITGGNIVFGNNGSSRTLVLQGTENTSLTVNATNEGRLILDGANSSGAVKAILSSAITGDNLTVNLNGDDANATQGAELTLAGGVNKIGSLSIGNAGSGASKGNKLILTGGATTITGGISVGADQELVIDFNKGNTTLSSTIASATNAVTTINVGNARGFIDGNITGDTNATFDANKGTLILTSKGSNTDIALKTVTNKPLKTGTNRTRNTPTYGNGNGISLYYKGRDVKDGFKTLTIGTGKNGSATGDGISGDGLNFVVFAKGNKNQQSAPSTYADKIVIQSSKNTDASTHYLGVVFADGTKLNEITYDEGHKDRNILIATVTNDSKVVFEESSTSILGFNVANVIYTTETDGTNTNYFIKSVKSSIIGAEEEITATAFSFNYDLYMANLNSLNKRMGELRENAHSQGVWARVFNGAQTNKQGLGTKSNYTTIQAGYDYAFGFEGSNNYLGFALSYALSTSASDIAFDIQGTVGFEDIYSNAIEVAVYNSYVSDIGWYNDTIVKFSYLMSNFSISDSLANQTMSNNTNNFAITLGDEVGYVFKLGESKEWDITPQVEFTFGYFNQSDLKRTLEGSVSYLNSVAESVNTLRARAGSSFSYNFKNFTQNKGFNASLYLGAFYEYDYISGGDISLTTEQQVTQNLLSNLKSDGRVVINVGTNMNIQDYTRLYFDFEKSFAGKITTDYQVNFGVRYSFGESDGYTPMVEKTEFKAPLKLDEGKDKAVQMEEIEQETKKTGTDDEEKNKSSKEA